MVKSDAGKGEIAEEVLAEYFRAAGFFAVRGVPFRHEGADLTDVDVWLYEKGAGASRRRIIVDSKNKKTPKVAERIFWTSGLRDALDLDGAYVASTSPKEETRKLARRVKISLIDVTALNRTGGSEGLQLSDRLSKEEIDRGLAQLDREHETKKWRSTRDEMIASVLMGFGGGTANVALRSSKYFAEQALAATDGSLMREYAQRMFYFSLAFVAISLDFVSAKSAFQPLSERRAHLEDILRFGIDPDETKRRLSLAMDLVRNYLANGSSLANQLHAKIDDQTKSIPVDIISDAVMKLSSNGHLFDVAKLLEKSANSKSVPSVADLGVEARSFAGAVTDFLGFDRVKLNKCLSEIPARADDAGTKAQSGNTLFDDKK